MSTEARTIKEEVRKYIGVFAGLLILTGVTVAISGLKVGIGLGVAAALLIATVKGGLVACYFMHLTSEKRLIYFVLILTVVFFFIMIALSYFAHVNLPEGARHVS